MNAASKLVYQHIASPRVWSLLLIKREYWLSLCLIIGILCSALGVIYVTHLNRVLHAQYQRTITEQDRLQVQRSQLLLERSTWMIQARIEQIAANKLGMIVPHYKSVVMVHE